MKNPFRLTPPIMLAAAAVLVSVLACTLAPPASPATPAPPTATTEPSPTPSPTPLVSVSPGEAAAVASVTDASGQAAVDDPLRGTILTLTALDDTTRLPVPGLQIWIMSVGTEVLVVSRDPNRIYAPTIEEISYSDLPENPMIALIVFPYAAISQSLEAWYTYFLIYPELDKWAIDTMETCAGPATAQPGLGGAEGPGTLMANLSLEATLTLSTHEYIAAPQELVDDLLASGNGSPVAQQYQNQEPALVRWETLTLHSDIPTFARPTEFCLDPIDRSDPQAILDWVQYGLENNALEVFEILAWEEGVGYANYLEGGQPNTREVYLDHLAARLPNGASCDGYSFADPWFQIWVSDWEPAWEITELCYLDCQPQEPPYVSDLGAFFFRPLEDGNWTLQTMWLNDASLWVEIYGAEVLGCEVPVQ